MKTKLLSLIIACLLLSNCTSPSAHKEESASNANRSEQLLNIDTDKYQIVLKKVKKTELQNATVGYHYEPYFGIKADYLSLKDLLHITMNVEAKDIIVENESLKNQYFSILIDQKLTSNNQQDSIIKSTVLDALHINIQKETLKVDTIIVSIGNKKKFLRHVNTTTPSSINDTNDTIRIRSEYALSVDSMTFENYEIEELLRAVNREYDNKPLVLNPTASQRVDFKLKRDDWDTVISTLESELGLTFTTKTSQEEKYIVTKKEE